MTDGAPLPFASVATASARQANPFVPSNVSVNAPETPAGMNSTKLAPSPHGARLLDLFVFGPIVIATGKLE